MGNCDTVGERLDTTREDFLKQGLLAVFGGELEGLSFAESGGARTGMEYDVQDGAANAADQSGLGVRGAQ